MSEEQEVEIPLEDLKDMCEKQPHLISIAKAPALDRAAKDFGLMTAQEIKDFICDGIENPIKDRPIPSELYKGVMITVYKFAAGKKNGYLAYHRSLAGNGGIHIKSFHLDDANTSIVTSMADVLKAALSKGKV